MGHSSKLYWYDCYSLQSL